MIRFFQEFITWKVSAAAASKNERKPDSLSPAAWVCDPSKAAHAVRFQALRGYYNTRFRKLAAVRAVSKNQLDFALVESNRVLLYLEVRTNKKGIGQFIKQVKSQYKDFVRLTTHYFV